MTLPVVQVPAEELQRLFVGEDATVLHARGCEGYHHPGITVHPAKLIEVLVAQALGEQAVRTKPFYQLREALRSRSGSAGSRDLVSHRRVYARADATPGPRPRRLSRRLR